jgi:hypothetical protein
VRAATVERPSPVDDERFATVRYRPPERDEHRGGGEVRIAGDEPAGDIGSSQAKNVVLLPIMMVQPADPSARDSSSMT